MASAQLQQPEQATNKLHWSHRNTIKLPSLFDNGGADYSSSDSDDEVVTTLKPMKVLANDIITSVPKSYSELLNILLPRLQPHLEKGKMGVPVEDQQELTQILFGELASQFKIIQHQINDPFLSASNNKELHRRVVVEVCTHIENLYESFLSRLFKIHHEMGDQKRATFQSRLKAELMVQVNQSLNIPSIRKAIIEELQGKVQESTNISSVPRLSTPRAPPTAKRALNELKKVKVHHPSMKILPPGYIQEVNAVGQSVIVSKKGFGHHNYDDTSDKASLIESDNVTVSSEVTGTEPMMATPTSIDYQMPLGLSHSLPIIKTSLINDEKYEYEHPIKAVEDIKDLNFGFQNDSGTNDTKVKLGEYTDEMIRQDLMNLVEQNSKVMKNSEEIIIDGEDDDNASLEISPLLAACGSGLSEKRKKALKQYMSRAEERLKNDKKSPPLKDHSLQEPSDIINDENGPSIHDLPLLATSISLGLSGLNLGESLPDSSAGGILSYSQSTRLDSATDLSRSELDSTNLIVDDENSSEQQQPSLVDTHSNSHQSLLSEIEPGTDKGEILSNVDLSIRGGSELSQLRPEDDNGTKELVGDPSSSVVPQPETVSFRVPNMEMARASGHRVYERTPQNFLSLKPFPNLYNELNGELDDLTIEKMDAVLQEGEDIQEIYDELSQILTKDHLEISKDPFLERDLHEKVNMSALYASNTLQRRRTLRVINEDLAHQGGEPPWNGMSRQDWLKKKEEVKEESKNNPTNAVYSLSNRRHKPSVTRIVEDPTMSKEEYQQFISEQGTDFLGVVHHMYNSSGSDSEDEERERKKQEHLRQLHLQLQEKERRKLEILKMKTRYIPGQWNANTVLMGGLGKAPDNLELQDDSDGTVTVEENNIHEIQAKLEVVWDRLQVPPKDRVDMTIVYSNPSLTSQLMELLKLWEKSCDMIETRERTLRDLEEFERNASIPSRHFHNRSSYRIAEEKIRSGLHYKLDAIEKRIIALANKLKQFKSILTYQGINYLEKMSMDRTEMLYFLHQEHRREVLLPSIKYLKMSQ